MRHPISSLFDTSPSRVLPAKEYLFRTGASVAFLYQVASGTIALRRTTHVGNEITLQVAGPGSLLAEASLYSNEYHCDAVALETSVVTRVACSTAREVLHKSPDLADNWAAYLARTVQKARTNSEIRSLKTVAARLDAWILFGGKLPQKGAYQDTASELSVTREALYRELARRKKLLV